MGKLGSLRPWAAGRSLRRKASQEAEQALRAPVSLTKETEGADVRKQPEHHAEGLRGEQRNVMGVGSPVATSLSRRVVCTRHLGSASRSASSPFLVLWLGVGHTGDGAEGRPAAGSPRGVFAEFGGGRYVGRAETCGCLFPLPPTCYPRGRRLAQQVPFSLGIPASWSFCGVVLMLAVVIRLLSFCSPERGNWGRSGNMTCSGWFGPLGCTGHRAQVAGPGTFCSPWKTQVRPVLSATWK